MPNPRDILNKLKWKQEYDFSQVEIWYLHRGAPQDTKIITGKNIQNIGKTFMDTSSATIPYHRIMKIIYQGNILFQRREIS